MGRGAGTDSHIIDVGTRHPGELAPDAMVDASGTVYLDNIPKIFRDAVRTDDHGNPRIVTESGGILSLNPDGGIFGGALEAEFRGNFKLSELRDFMDQLYPFVESSLETVEIKAAGENFVRQLDFRR